MLARHELLVAGVLRPTTGDVPLADRREISGGLRYLLETHGPSALAPWLSDSLKRTLGLSRGTLSRRGGEFGARAIMASLNLAYVAKWEGESGDHFSYSARAVTEALPIEGYAYALRLSNNSVHDSLKVAGGTFVRFGSDSSSLRVTRDGAALLDIPCRHWWTAPRRFGRRNRNQQLPPAVLCVERHTAGAGALVCFKHLTGVRRQGAVRLTWFEGEVFLRLQ